MRTREELFVLDIMRRLDLQPAGPREWVETANKLMQELRAIDYLGEGQLRELEPPGILENERRKPCSSRPH